MAVHGGGEEEVLGKLGEFSMESTANGTANSSESNHIVNILNHIIGPSDEEKGCIAKQTGNENQGPGCGITWDTLLCWPYTSPGTLAQIPCRAEIHGTQFDTTQNASRWCWANGTWEDYPNYSECIALVSHAMQQAEITTKIYFVGYSLSLFSLIFAVLIFLYFKELRCLRNNIHTHLMLTYILSDLTWIITTAMQITVTTDIHTCNALFSLLNYFQLTNFFWMFVEGLYLYLLVVQTFLGNNIKLRLCILIGWGIPILVTAVWAMAKSLGLNLIAENSEEPLWKHCPWMIPHPYDWIYQAAAIGVLCMNVIFLFMIMWVLITKLRSANNIETQQYRKASKALLVLIPLLGITYVLVLYGPEEGAVSIIFIHARAFLLSSQGLLVALFYCFLNAEVQNTVRHHFSRWSNARNIGADKRYYNNWSPRSRTESIRLFCQPADPYQKRESTVSETTTTTVIGLNSTTAFLDKSNKIITEE